MKLKGAGGPVDILHSLTFSLSAGEIVGLVGPSGSGKTSLMLLLAGLERPSQGSIQLMGQELTTLDEQQRAAFRLRHLGIVFQNFHLIPTLSALENAALPLELRGQENANGKAKELLSELGLGHRLAHYPAQLSGGEQQRVAIARAMIGDPALILADEPTGNLDQATGAKVIDLLFHLHGQRKNALLLITHDPALARKCNRILHLRDGKLES